MRQKPVKVSGHISAAEHLTLTEIATSNETTIGVIVSAAVAEKILQLKRKPAAAATLERDKRRSNHKEKK